MFLNLGDVLSINFKSEKYIIENKTPTPKTAIEDIITMNTLLWVDFLFTIKLNIISRSATPKTIRLIVIRIGPVSNNPLNNNTINKVKHTIIVNKDISVGIIKTITINFKNQISNIVAFYLF